MQAITTKYVGPRNVRGSRIIATVVAGRVIVDYDDALSANENHALAAETLARKFAWIGDNDKFDDQYAAGVTHRAEYVFVRK